MKYYILEPDESNKIGYFKVSNQHHVDAKCGKLKNNKFAIPVAALYGSEKINGIDFKHKIPRLVNPNEWVKPESNPK